MCVAIIRINYSGEAYDDFITVECIILTNITELFHTSLQVKIQKLVLMGHLDIQYSESTSYIVTP